MKTLNLIATTKNGTKLNVVIQKYIRKTTHKELINGARHNYEIVMDVLVGEEKCSLDFRNGAFLSLNSIQVKKLLGITVKPSQNNNCVPLNITYSDYRKWYSETEKELRNSDILKKDREIHEMLNNVINTDEF